MGLMKLKLLPICTQQPKTMSFREEIYKTVNSVCFDVEAECVETPESWFTNSSDPASSSSTDYDLSTSEDQCQVEAIIRGAQQSTTEQQRLFFEPGGETSSILSDLDSPRLRSDQDIRNLSLAEETLQEVETGPLKDSVMIVFDTEDPYGDFKQSMKEMVESLGVQDDWEGLEELLAWYLRVNDKINHGYIIGAFVDLLAAILDDDDTSHKIHTRSHLYDDHGHEISVNSSTSFSSATSSLSSSVSTTRFVG